MCVGKKDTAYEGGREGGREATTTYLLGRRTVVSALDTNHD